MLDGPPHYGGFVGTDPFDPPGGAGVGDEANFGALAFPVSIADLGADYEVKASDVATAAFDKLAQSADLVSFQAAGILTAAGSGGSVQAGAVPARRALQWTSVRVASADPDWNTRLLHRAWGRTWCHVSGSARPYS